MEMQKEAKQDEMIKVSERNNARKMIYLMMARQMMNTRNPAAPTDK